MKPVQTVDLRSVEQANRSIDTRTLSSYRPHHGELVHKRYSAKFAGRVRSRTADSPAAPRGVYRGERTAGDREWIYSPFCSTKIHQLPIGSSRVRRDNPLSVILSRAYRPAVAHIYVLLRKTPYRRAA